MWQSEVSRLYILIYLLLETVMRYLSSEVIFSEVAEPDFEFGKTFESEPFIAEKILISVSRPPMTSLSSLIESAIAVIGPI
jgi:hypothetical protein